MELLTRIANLSNLEQKATPIPWQMVKGPAGCIPEPKPGYIGLTQINGGILSGGDATIWFERKSQTLGYPSQHEAIAINCLHIDDAKLIINMRNDLPCLLTIAMAAKELVEDMTSVEALSNLKKALSV